jgi:small GTP-binding protein
MSESNFLNSLNKVVAIKVIIVGNGQVGKTSMIKRFASGEYDDKYKKTIGAAFKEKELFIKSANKTVKFMLWDTAGQEGFQNSLKLFRI